MATLSPRGAQFTAKTIKPTPEQLAIQTSDADTLIVLANAGAAKTTTLALRMAEGLARGLSPTSILALTYTEPACDALREALRKIGVPAAEVKALWISTFERFATYVLKSKEGAVPRQVKDPEALQATVWQAVQQLAENEHKRWADQLVLPSVGDTEFVERFLQIALRLKGKLSLEALFWLGERLSLNAADDLGEDFSMLCLLHTSERLRCPPESDLPAYRAALDATYDLARSIADPEQPDAIDLYPTWPRRVNMLMLDEMHDMNQAMFSIVRALLQSNPNSHFCGVGDIDQVLHAHAGADARFLDRAVMAQELGRTATPLPLTASYRFSQDIADLAGHFANKAYASRAPHASGVHTVFYDTAQDCAQQVAQAALQWQAAKHRMSELAVLLRHPYQSVLIENALLAADLPYVTRGLEPYLQRPEVLLVRALLAVASNDFAAVQSADTRRRMVEQLVAFCRIELSFGMDASETPAARLQEAVRHVVQDPSTLVYFFEGQILQLASARVAKRLRTAMDVARTPAAPDSFAQMLQALDMRSWATEHWVEHQRRADALAHLQGLQAAATQHGSASAFFAELNRVELQLQAQRSTRTAKAGAIILADIAAVKGLEFDHVLLPGLAQQEFPSRERLSMTDERNLFYVALTRARTDLTLLVNRAAPSSFLDEL